MQNAFIIKDTITFHGSSFKKNLTNEKAVPFFFHFFVHPKTQKT